jgi:cell division protein FtsB
MRDPEFFDDDGDFFADDEEQAGLPRRDMWQRLSQLMVACLFVLVLAGILRVFWPEIQRHRELSAETRRLETIRDDKLARVAELQRQNEWMMTDREYLESIARDRLDMAHENEVVVRIDRESGARALERERERERQKRLEQKLAGALSADQGEVGDQGEEAGQEPIADHESDVPLGRVGALRAGEVE